MPEDRPVNDTSISVADAGNRTARGVVQNTLAGAITTLIIYFFMDDAPPATVTLAIAFVLAAVLTFVQNLWENTVGKAFLKKVPEEPRAARPARRTRKKS